MKAEGRMTRKGWGGGRKKNGRESGEGWKEAGRRMGRTPGREIEDKWEGG